MPDTNDTLPAFEDWTPPWGEPENIDEAKARKLVYDLKLDKAKQAQRITALQADVKRVEGERDTAKQALDAKSREGESETDRLKRELEEANAKLEKAGETSVNELRLEVALEKGLTAVQAKRLVGTTKEELSADADALVESFGGTGKAGDGGEGGETGNPRRNPRQRRNPADPDDNGNPSDSRDTMEILDAEIPRSTF